MRFPGQASDERTANSLNASVAAGVLMYEVVRQRRSRLNMQRREDVLLVDGYNMIGAWPDAGGVAGQSIGGCTRSAAGYACGLSRLYRHGRLLSFSMRIRFLDWVRPSSNIELTVVFTKEKETADACIERLGFGAGNAQPDLYVATSDLVEQHVAFGKGALRISARELLIDIEQNRKADRTNGDRSIEEHAMSWTTI